jgi:hypothetical protein
MNTNAFGRELRRLLGLGTFVKASPSLVEIRTFVFWKFGFEVVRLFAVEELGTLSVVVENPDNVGWLKSAAGSEKGSMVVTVKGATYTLAAVKPFSCEADMAAYNQGNPWIQSDNPELWVFEQKA